MRKKLGILGRKLAVFGAIKLEGEIDAHKVHALERRSTDLHEHITKL